MAFLSVKKGGLQMYPFLLIEKRKNSISKHQIMRVLLLLLLSLMTSLAIGQQTRLSYRLQNIALEREKMNEPIAVLIKGDVISLKEEIKRLNGVVKFTSGNICSAILPAGNLLTLSDNAKVVRIEEGRVNVQALNDKMLINNRIDLVHQGVSPLIQGYDGSGVVVGIIDTGLDFTHPDFKDSLGQSRVLWIWDHLLANGTNTPQPYNYGQEFSKAAIDAGNASTHVDQTAHGTHVTGIATANGDSLAAFKGAAPKADIIAVSLNFNIDDETWLSSIADAVHYIFSKADSLNKPCVINISAGTYLGSHDGKDLQAEAIDNLITAKNGRMVVAAAGNAGNFPLHLRHQPNNDSTFTWFRQTSPNPVYIEFWADTANLNGVQFTIGADMITPSYTNRAQLPWTTITPQLGVLGSDTLWSFNGNRIAIIQTYGQLIGNKYSMVYNIIPDSTTYYFRLMAKGTGSYDVWNWDMVFSGLPSSASYPAIVKYKMPDLAQNICSSFQCSDIVLCVGQYVNRNNYIDVNGNLQTFATTEGALGASSSRGPTRDGRIKPDITSTGEVTLASLKLSSAAWFLANQPFKLAQGGMHIRDGGTSSAAPVVAGAIALYLQKNPTTDWQDIRNRVLLCSKQDNFTGSNLPNNNWGIGKFDAFSMVSGCAALSVDEKDSRQLLIYPNPTGDRLTVRSNDNIQISGVVVYNSLGERILDNKPNLLTEEMTLSLSGFPSGMYMIVTDLKNGKRFSGTIIKE